MGNKKTNSLELLFHPVLQLILRVFIGILLIYFSIYKLSDPQQWAEVIYQYRIIPISLVNLASIMLAWMEFFAGVGLLLGIYTRGSAFVGGITVGVFTFGVAFNLARKVFIYCGCFRKQAYPTDVAKSTLQLSILILIVLLLIFLNSKPKIGLDQLLEGRKKNKS
jgi:uncharacterized membrane protein YphA (DoxX/SURF4 family)